MQLGRSVRVFIVVALVAASGLASAGPGRAGEEFALEGGSGQVDHHEYGLSADGTRLYDYLVYTPAGWDQGDQLPLYVALHGCGMSGAAMMAATWLNPIADRERFIVAYPDNGENCWGAVSNDVVLNGALNGAVAAVDPSGGAATQGDGGEAEVVAGITKRIIERYNVDTSRVYLAGGSAGGFQTGLTAVKYPELYAAVGIVAGGGPGMAVTCAAHQTPIVPTYASWAVAEMGERAHIMPFFVLGGTLDPLGETAGVTGCSELAYQEMLYINNLLRPSAKAPIPGVCGLLPPALTGLQGGVAPCVDTFMTNPYATKHGQVPDGYTWTRNSAQDTGTMCEIGQQWIVHGMGHTWPGRSDNAAWRGDPKGPSASELSWDFFKRFHLEDGNVVCHSGDGAP